MPKIQAEYVLLESSHLGSTTYRVERIPEPKTGQMGHGGREVNRQPVVIISVLSLTPSVPKREFRCQTITYPETFDELDNTRYDDKGTKECNCPCPRGYV